MPDSFAVDVSSVLMGASGSMIGPHPLIVMLMHGLKLVHVLRVLLGQGIIHVQLLLDVL